MANNNNTGNRQNRQTTRPAAPKPADAVQVTQEAPVEEKPAIASLVIQDEDGEQVRALKEQLTAFVGAVSLPGKVPADFVGAARLSLQVAKYITQFPKVEVLDAYSAFIEETIDDVSAGTSYLKGTDQLSKVDEQLVGTLYALFADLARKQFVRVNTGMLMTIFKKPEIGNYYNRRISGIVNSN